MPAPSKYYRIYTIVGGNMSKQVLRLPEPWAQPKKRMLSANHFLPDRDEAIAILEELMVLQEQGEDIGTSGVRPSWRPRNLKIRRQLALAELGRDGSGEVIAVTTNKDKVVRLD